MRVLYNLTMQTSVCSKCKKRKPISEFYIYTGACGHKAGSPHASCKRCQHDARNEYRRKHPEQAAAAARRHKLKRLFGITVDQYNEMLAEQDGVCAICRRASPDGRRLHVDHCHKTKTVRGLLCHDCNRGLGMFRDDPENFSRAAEYLLTNDIAFAV